MDTTVRRGFVAAGVVLLLSGPVWAQAPAPEPSPEAEAAARGEPSQPDVGSTSQPETAASEELPWPVYVPPSRGATAAAVGAGTRGTRKGLPAVHALAPTHAGLTMLEQPTVWWHLWERTDTRVDVTLSVVNVEDPLLEVTLPSPTEAGWHVLRLADHDTRLEKGTVYEWFVALVPDPEQRSRDVIARGIIERRDPPEQLRRELAATPPNRAFEVLARHGYWYEAVSNLSEQSRAAPGKTQLRAARASLLEQIGQDDLAERERDSVSAQ